jgi:hypothetical protein
MSGMRDKMNNDDLLYKRYQYMSNELNKAAYGQQTKNRKTKLKQFVPCNKALLFTRAMGETKIPVSSLVIHDASLEVCNCHNGMGEKELWELYYQSIDAMPG